jgi:hypothetical protein
MFGYKEGDFPVTEDVAGRTIANLKEEQIDYVVEKLKGGFPFSWELHKQKKGTGYFLAIM